MKCEVPFDTSGKRMASRNTRLRLKNRKTFVPCFKEHINVASLLALHREMSARLINDKLTLILFLTHLDRISIQIGSRII